MANRFLAVIVLLATALVGASSSSTSGINTRPNNGKKKKQLRGSIMDLDAAFVGCFLDSSDAPAMDHHQDASMKDPGMSYDLTIKTCLLYCFSKQYPFAGVQNQSDCFCGKEYNAYGPATSDKECLEQDPCEGGDCKEDSRLSVFATQPTSETTSRRASIFSMVFGGSETAEEINAEEIKLIPEGFNGTTNATTMEEGQTASPTEEPTIDEELVQEFLEWAMHRNDDGLISITEKATLLAAHPDKEDAVWELINGYNAGVMHKANLNNVTLHNTTLEDEIYALPHVKGHKTNHISEAHDGEKALEEAEEKKEKAAELETDPEMKKELEKEDKVAIGKEQMDKMTPAQKKAAKLARHKKKLEAKKKKQQEELEAAKQRLYDAKHKKDKTEPPSKGHKTNHISEAHDGEKALEEAEEKKEKAAELEKDPEMKKELEKEDKVTIGKEKMDKMTPAQKLTSSPTSVPNDVLPESTEDSVNTTSATDTDLDDSLLGSIQGGTEDMISVFEDSESTASPTAGPNELELAKQRLHTSLHTKKTPEPSSVPTSSPTSVPTSFPTDISNTSGLFGTENITSENATDLLGSINMLGLEDNATEDMISAFEESTASPTASPNTGWFSNWFSPAASPSSEDAPESDSSDGPDNDAVSTLSPSGTNFSSLESIIEETIAPTIEDESFLDVGSTSSPTESPTPSPTATGLLSSVKSFMGNRPSVAKVVQNAVFGKPEEERDDEDESASSSAVSQSTIPKLTSMLTGSKNAAAEVPFPEFYVGCFVDIKRQSAMEYNCHSYHNIVTCRNYCQERGYEFAGLEEGWHCFCGNHYDFYGQVDNGECDAPCIMGDLGHCGGMLRLSVYHSNGVSGDL